LVSLLGLASMAQAQAPKLLKDINAIPISNPSSNPGSMPALLWPRPQFFSQLGNVILLEATTRSQGKELWVSDGTKAGTKLLKDIRPGVESSSPEKLVVTNDGKSAFFWANDGKTGIELWVTDGSSTGTHLVQDIFSGPGSTGAQEIVPFGASSVIFRAYTKAQGSELFISDGTSKGTKVLRDIQPGAGSSAPNSFCVTHDGKRVFFSAESGAIGFELWVTDGTTAGTVLVKDINVGTQGTEITTTVPLGPSNVMFKARIGKKGPQWWISDGTAAGTKMLVDPKNGPNAGPWESALALGNKVIFEGTTPTHGTEAYVTDGTVKGTVLLIDAVPGAGSGWMSLPRLDSTGKKVYWFVAPGVNKARIFVSDGTRAGTKVFAPKINGSITGPPVEMGGKVYFQGKDVTPGTGNELCVSDGTVAGTKTLRDTVAGSSSGGAGGISRFKGTSLFYAADDQVHGMELWSMSAGQTFKLFDINNPQPSPTHSAYPLGIARFGKHVLFSAFDGVSGTETWISDGTTAGTRLLKDLAPGITSSLSHYYAVVGDKLIFDAFTPKTGMELFMTDGTPAGTKLLKDIRSGPLSSYPSYLAAVGDKVYFACNDGSSGFEPWVTDGTPGGTKLLMDIYPGSLSSSPGSFAGQGGQVLFSAVGPNGRHGLYLTNGSSKGTRLLRQIYVGGMTFSGGLVYFSGYERGTGRELWVTDFTSSGTVLVTDLVPGPESGLQSSVSARNGLVYFTGYTQATGTELFVSNGTPAGTRPFLKKVPGTIIWYPHNISAIGSRHVYFTGYTTAAGQETMISDGTSAGTRALDINPGSRDGAASFPYASDHRATLGSQVFFPAVHPLYGLEIFTVDNGATAEPIGTPYGSTWIQGSDPVIGQTAHIQGLTGLANPIHLTVMGTLAARPLRFGSSSFLHIDLSAFFRITPAAGGSQILHSIPIPNSQSLKGVQLVFQTLAFDSSNFIATVELSNAMHWTLGN